MNCASDRTHMMGGTWGRSFFTIDTLEVREYE